MAKLSWGSILFLWVLSNSTYAADTTKPVITLQGSNPAIVILNTTYSDAGATAMDDIDGSNVTVIPNTQSVDTSEVGSYSVEYTATDSAGNTQTATRTVNIIVNIIPIITLLLLDDEPDDGVDRTPPVITLFGDNPVFVLVGSSYMDAGASATDNIDGPLNVSDNANIVSTSTVASYSIKFTATDNAGNTGTAFRTVNIVEDNTAPEITLNGNASVTIEAGSTYTDAGALALDDFDGSVAVTPTINFDTASVGTHSNAVTYTATDSSNNIATAYRDVEVVDTTPPAITTNSITIEAGSLYTNDGVTTTDNSNGVITLKRNSLVDTATVGQTTVSYTATDSSGHSVNKDITVVIADTTPPEIIIAGEASVTIEAGETYADAGVVTDDNSNGVVNIETTGSIIDTTVVGTYTVTYTATDPSGRSAEATRTVKVVDTTAPEISLTGRNPLAIIVVEGSYTEEGYTTTNNSTGQVNVDINSSAVNTAVEGSYEVVYTATDSASGKSTVVKRTVNVISSDSVAPVITLMGANPVVVVQNSVYTDAGATAMDSFDGLVDVFFAPPYDTTPFDTSVVSTTVTPTFSFGLIATDTAGNVSTITRQIEVVKADTTQPIIFLNGKNPATIEVGSAYTDAGAIAIDDHDGVIEDGNLFFILSNDVNTSTAGTYSVIYKAIDVAGNWITKEREVNVVVPEVIPPNMGNLTGQWHLDENIGLITNGLSDTNNLILNNMVDNSDDPSHPNNWVSGKSGSALNFVGGTSEQDVSIGSATNAIRTPSVTLSAWIKPTQISGEWEWIAAQGDNYGLYLYPDSRQLVFYYKRNLTPPDPDIGENWAGVSSPINAIDFGVWQHVAGTFDATTNTIKVFVNGIEVNSMSVTEGIKYDTGNGFTIGSMKGERFFNGVIDEVNVYDAAHTIDNINYLMGRVTADTQKPVITLTGAETVDVVINTNYADQGAIAVDNIDGAIEVAVDVTAVDISTLGSYSVSYLATDSAGNTKKEIRTVNIMAADTTPPVITLKGTNPATIPVGVSYTDKGATVTDNVDPATIFNSTAHFVVDSSSVLTTTAGVYAVTFTATDTAGNIKTGTRKVIVSDNPRVDESVFVGRYDGTIDRPPAGQRGSIVFNDYIDLVDPGAIADWLTQSTGNITKVYSDAGFTAALSAAQPGDRIQLAEGTYRMQNIHLSGSPENPITIESIPGQWAIFDGEKAGSTSAINVQGSWLNFRNFEVKRGSASSIYTEQSHHLLYEGLLIHNNANGFEFTNGSHHSMIRYNESYHNYKLSNHGEDGDGFTIWSENNDPIGEGVILEHNIAWGNSDDGIDMWMNQTTVTMRNNISRNNGFNVLSETNFVGNGNGFKLGPLGTGHVIIGNIADSNPTDGFDHNGGTDAHYVKGNIATNNSELDFDIPHRSVFIDNYKTGGVLTE